MINIVCAVAKNENKYINEWCTYYLSLGFKKIYIFDNNDKGSPSLENYLDQKIRSSVIIIDKQGIREQCFQWHCYQEFYDQYKTTFDWCLFCDIDEFLIGIESIDNFLIQPKFRNFDQIRIKWKVYGDDELLERDLTQPVFNAFKTEVINPKFSQQGKSIIRGNLVNIKFNSGHYAVRYLPWNDQTCNLTSCLPSGKPNIKDYFNIYTDYSTETIFLNHYMTRSLLEFLLYKFNRSDAVYKSRQLDLDYYWQINLKTEQKINYINKFILDLKKDH